MPAELHDRPINLLFVLAGAKSRKLFGISEFDRGVARRLILSTGRFELRRFPELPIAPKPDLLAQAARIPPPERHCFVLFPPEDQQVVWIKVQRFGTMSEIEALRDWLLMNNDVKSVEIVSSGYHLPRVRLCCRFLLPKNVKVSFLSVPGEEVAWRNWALEWIKGPTYLLALTAKTLRTM